jgi:hypothetical protein
MLAPLLGRVWGAVFTLLGTVACSLRMGAGGGSHGSWATFSAVSFFCHSWKMG